MANAQGDFIWYELMTSDAAAAADFYGRIVGWSEAPAGGSTRGYRIFSAGGQGVAGLMDIPKDAADGGMKPGWLGYVGVDDVDAAATAIAAAGGRVHMGPTDIPGAGRLAFATDPQGAPFYVMRGAGDAESLSFRRDAPGHCGWNELHTSDWPAAFDFYAGLFGWTKTRAMDMGPMGTYQLFAPKAGGDDVGAMFNSPSMPRPTWLFYFAVPDLDLAMRRIEEAGGVRLFGPQEVPGGDHIVHGRDPQGAMFALVGPLARPA